MKIKAYSVLTNLAAGLATASVVYDAHKIGKNYSNANLIRGGGDDLVADLMGAQRLNYPSEKYNKIKQETFKYKLGYGVKDVFHKGSGYLQGVGIGLAHNWNTLGCALITFLAKKKPLKVAGAIGVGLSVAWNFIKNGTNFLEHKDYLRY